MRAVRQVLDAPQLQDDFYLNLVDWSSQNVLAVGLGTCVYLWSACTSKVGQAPTGHAFPELPSDFPLGGAPASRLRLCL